MSSPHIGTKHEIHLTRNGSSLHEAVGVLVKEHRYADAELLMDEALALTPERYSEIRARHQPWLKPEPHERELFKRVWDEMKA